MYACISYVFFVDFVCVTIKLIIFSGRNISKKELLIFFLKTPNLSTFSNLQEALLLLLLVCILVSTFLLYMATDDIVKS